MDMNDSNLHIIHNKLHIVCISFFYILHIIIHILFTSFSRQIRLSLTKS